MALFAFDGTGQDAEDTTAPTNVARFRDAYQQTSFYYPGIGTKGIKPLRALASATGLGGVLRVWDAEDDLRQLLQSTPDAPIDIVGFSRGAALAIEFANEIHDRFKGAREIRFLGLFDTVHSFGLANLSTNFIHDPKVPESVAHCFHALAMDERRETFPVTRVNGHEVWFRGCHSDIGGGNGNSALNAIALHWMMTCHQGITSGDDRCFTQSMLDLIEAERNVDAPIKEPRFDPKKDPYRSILSDDLIHSSVTARPDHNNAPAGIGVA